MPSAPKPPKLQVLGACVALLCATPIARAQSAEKPSYERLRAQVRAARVSSPEQARELRGSLGAVELEARVTGVMSNRRGQIVMLQCGEGNAVRTITLDVPPSVAEDRDSARALRSGARIRILARVSPNETEPLLVLLAATDKVEAPLFSDANGEGVEIISPVNGALPQPPLSESALGGPRAVAGLNEPDPFSSLPRARVPAKARTPLVPMASVPPAPRVRPLQPRARLSSRSARAPRGYLAPPAASIAPPMAVPAGMPSAVRAVPSLSPLTPEVLASAQKRAPRAQAAPAKATASEPMMFADDEGIESQMPAYRNMVRRFNKKLSPELVEEIASGLLAAAYSQNMDPRFLAAIVAVESDFDPRCLSSSGAMGLGQVMPFNMPEVGMQKADAWNPTKNLLATAMLLRGHLDDFKDRPNGTLLAVAAYNAGPNAVKRAGYRVPKGAQVQRYVWKVYYRYKEFAPELFR